MSQLTEYRFLEKWMGSIFTVVIVAQTPREADIYFDLAKQEVTRIEHLLSEFIPSSDTARINQSPAHLPISLHEETVQLIARSKAISQIAQGAFDITVGPLKKLYHFKKEVVTTFPHRDVIRETLSKVGISAIQIIDATTIKKEKEGMHLSFASIGKGYAADRVRKIWEKEGLKNGIISASGDLCVLGKRADHTHWQVSISSPHDRNQSLFVVPMTENYAVATSGDSEQFFIQNGIKYSHNIDPKSGYPLQHISSVSVFAVSAELCDALATAVSVMGIEAGLCMVNQMEHVHAIIVDSQNTIHFSQKIKHQYQVNSPL